MIAAWACPALGPPPTFALPLTEYPRGLAPRSPRRRGSSRVSAWACPARPAAAVRNDSRGLAPRWAGHPTLALAADRAGLRVGLPSRLPRAAAVRNDSRVGWLAPAPPPRFAMIAAGLLPRLAPPPRFNSSIRVGLPSRLAPPPRFAMIAAWACPRLPRHGGSTRVSAWACPRACPGRRGLHDSRAPAWAATHVCPAADWSIRVGLPRARPAAAVRTIAAWACPALGPPPTFALPLTEYPRACPRAYPATPVQPEYPRACSQRSLRMVVPRAVHCGCCFHAPIGSWRWRRDMARATRPERPTPTAKTPSVKSHLPPIPATILTPVVFGPNAWFH